MVYPNLRSGVAAQYPLRRRTRHHIVSTRTPGGHVSRIVGGSAPEMGWELQYENLTDEEAQGLEDLFVATGGGLKCFTFVDPLANLLLWSEDLNAAAWQRTGLAVEALTEGGEAWFRLTNTSQAPAVLAQQLELPDGAVCMSCEARASAGSALTVFAGWSSRVQNLSDDWRRVWTAGGAGSGGLTSCGMEVPAGGVVDVRRLQAEAQSVPSAYRKNCELSGIHPAARFDHDGLRIVAQAPGRNSAVVRVRSRQGSAA